MSFRLCCGNSQFSEPHAKFRSRAGGDKPRPYGNTCRGGVYPLPAELSLSSTKRPYRDFCKRLSYQRGVAGGLIEIGCPRWFGGVACVVACAAGTAALQGPQGILGLGFPNLGPPSSSSAFGPLIL